uniref:uncharacterized protein LOC122578927 n=1 Tax=Erigeron canadensis TaxID=72917 RepID=UPI001CB9AE64|nr:uncharacterized protein LOC122578927 [Erigeron canadensis]
MDTTTTLSPNLPLLNSLLPSSPSKSNLQPPEILNSINELSDVSTALSAFFHDLRNHITSISSAIDAQLPPHLLLFDTTTNATTTKPIFAEQNPNGTEKSNGQLTVANNNDDDDLGNVVEESNDKLDGIDLSNKKEEKESDLLVSEQDIDIMIEDMDCQCNAIIEVDIIQKRKSFGQAGEIDDSKEDEGTDVSNEEDPETDVAQKNKKRKLEETHVSKEDEEIEILKEKDRDIDVSKKKPDEIDTVLKKKKKDEEIGISMKKHDKTEALKRPAEIDVSMKPEISDILWKPDAEIDILTKTKEREMSKKDAEDDTFKRPAQFDASKEPQEETEVSKRLVENDILNRPKESDVLKEAQEETNASNKLIEIDILNKPEEIDVLKILLEETDASKKPVENDVLNQSEEVYVLSKPGEIDVPKKPDEIDVSNKPEEIDVLKKPLKETDASKKPVENDVLTQPDEVYVLNKPEEIDIPKKPNEIYVSNKPEEIDVSQKPDKIDVSNKSENFDVWNKPEQIDVSNKVDEIDASKNPTIAVLEYLCKEMRAYTMKKHVLANISEMNSLHQEIAKALKLAINPAKLVLDSIGRFFLQTNRAYCYRESRQHNIAVRQASVLILECFVMISGDGIEITKEDREYSENTAIEWRKQMIKEGGLIYMETVDARGLLLFISGFGIPDDVFSNKDLSDLIRASNVKEISKALCHSTILIPKLPEIIDWMVKNNLEIVAVDMVYTFGLEDKCHPETILMTFLHNKIKDTQSGSSLQVYAATMQQLSDLKSIRGVLETHKIDPSKFLPSVNINEKIDQLEKVIYELDLRLTEEKSTLKRKGNEIDVSKKPAIAMLELLCKEMSAKKMKKHVVAHISEMNSLHQEIAKALKLARNPVKLVLDSIGRYFLQSSGAYYSSDGHRQIAIRQASVLILECFVIISGDGIKITKEDAEYANNAAIDWRKRMLKEGGLICMEAIDAKGLLLFISGFGIPDGVFSNEDFRDLIKASSAKEISNALRHSTILIHKLPEVIDWMVKNNLEIEAADIAYTFGLEDKCHPETILLTFLHNKIQDIQSGSSLQVYASTIQQLSDLKSIRGCLETHKIDPSKFLPAMKINEKLEQLEKVINEQDLKSTGEKSTLKRKEKETDLSKDPNNQQQAKRICFSHENLSHEQNPHDHYGIHPFKRSTQPSCSSYFDQNLPNSYYVIAYSASSVFSAPVLPPNITSSVHGGLAGSYGPYVYGGLVAEAMPHTNNPGPYFLLRGQPHSRQSQACDPYPSLFTGMPDHSLPGGFFKRGVPSSNRTFVLNPVDPKGSTSNQQQQQEDHDHPQQHNNNNNMDDTNKNIELTEINDFQITEHQDSLSVGVSK